MAERKYPVGITSTKAKADVVRQVARELQLAYVEAAVEGRDDLVRFTFGPLGSADSHRIARAMPRDVYYYQAVFVDPMRDEPG